LKRPPLHERQSEPTAEFRFNDDKLAEFENYYAWLRPVSARIDMWMTTYVLMFDGPEMIADWFAGSALQPFLELLSDDERCAFLGRYRDGLRDAYPAQPDGKVLLPYPRLFIVAVRG
jgi:trans-aconitate 2-methyltransferase